MPRKPDIAIFGAGAWGTALAMTWARQGAQVDLWGHPLPWWRPWPGPAGTRPWPTWNCPGGPAPRRPRGRLPGPPLGERPAHPGGAPGVGRIWPGAPPCARNCLISVSKGILQGHLQARPKPWNRVLGVPVGASRGPTFADEVSRRTGPPPSSWPCPPTCPTTGPRRSRPCLATPTLRVYLSRDVPGVELCGAFKNVLAIAAGLVESLGLGNNARAALITRGLAEMARLVEAMGGSRETLMGLAGLGDLVLTATGPQSRNRTFGALVGKGMTPQAAAAGPGQPGGGGRLHRRRGPGPGHRLGVELPITQEVVNLLKGADPLESVNRLMQRSLKPEVG